MEQHNYKFLNYKTYAKFLEDLNASKIRTDAIVFIQENLRIWARGKEYICGGPGNAFVSDGSFLFKDISGNDIFTARINGNTISLTDSNNVSLSIDVVTPADLDAFSALIDLLYQRKGDSTTPHTNNNMVTLSASDYQDLVDLNLVETDTYYFTYEDWTFGDTFPTTLS